MLFVPATLRTDGTHRQVTREARIVRNEAINHSTPGAGPLLTPAFQAGPSEAKTFLRRSALTGQFNKELIDLRAVRQEGNGAIRLNDSQENGIFLTPRAGTERGARFGQR